MMPTTMIQIKQGSVLYCQQCGRDLKDHNYAMLSQIPEAGERRSEYCVLKCLKCSIRQED